MTAPDNVLSVLSVLAVCDSCKAETVFQIPLPVPACFHPAVLDDVQADMAQVCTAVLEQEGCVEPAVACECAEVAEDCET